MDLVGDEEESPDGGGPPASSSGCDEPSDCSTDGANENEGRGGEDVVGERRSERICFKYLPACSAAAPPPCSLVKRAARSRLGGMRARDENGLAHKCTYFRV